MKKKYIYVTLSGLLLLVAACQSNMEYDISNGLLDNEITLFEKEISLPVGSAGPFCLDLILNPVSNFFVSAGLPEDILSAGDDGIFLFKIESEIVDENLYSLAINQGENSEPWVWELDDESSYAALGLLLPSVGITLHNQEYTMEASSFLRVSVPLNGKVSIKSTNDDKTTWEQSVDLKDFSLPRNGERVVLATFQVPEENTKDEIELFLSEPKVTLPANFGKRVIGSGMFTCFMMHKTNVSLGEDFSVSVPLDLDVNIPLSVARLREATVTMELENTAPLNLEVLQVHALNPDGKENPNIEITPDIRLLGGSPDAPSSSRISLGIKTLDGKLLPDINRISIQVKATSAPGRENVLLSTRQGVSVRHSSINIRGGITLFGNEN